MATATRKTAKDTNKIAAFVEAKASEFLGPDGMKPVVGSISGGVSIIYQDVETGFSVTIRCKGGRTTTQVSAPRSLRCYEAASLAATIKIAADFAVNLDLFCG